MIQEDLIKCCKEEIIEHILKEVKENIYYSIIFDETTDIKHFSQMSLFLKYMDSKKNIQERFVAFINCHDSIYHQNKIIINEDTDKIEADKLNTDDLSMKPKLTGKLFFFK